MDQTLMERHNAAARIYGESSACAGKIDYGSEETATAAAEAMTAKRLRDLEPYPCPFCDGWHIGRKMTEREFRRLGL